MPAMPTLAVSAAEIGTASRPVRFLTMNRNSRLQIVTTSVVIVAIAIGFLLLLGLRYIQGCGAADDGTGLEVTADCFGYWQFRLW
jgi:hypothetical protein